MLSMIGCQYICQNQPFLDGIGANGWPLIRRSFIVEWCGLYPGRIRRADSLSNLSVQALDI